MININKSINISSYYPKFNGITVLIPGHLYEDEKGVEIIYLGFGDVKDYCKFNNEEYKVRWGSNNEFLYIKKKKLDKAINKNNKFADTINKLMLKEEGDVFKYINMSNKPRKFIKDLGEYFPLENNDELTKTFCTNTYEHNCRCSNYWVIDFK